MPAQALTPGQPFNGYAREVCLYVNAVAVVMGNRKNFIMDYWRTVIDYIMDYYLCRKRKKFICFNV